MSQPSDPRDAAAAEALLALLHYLRTLYDPAYQQVTDWHLRGGTAYPHIVTDAPSSDTP